MVSERKRPSMVQKGPRLDLRETTTFGRKRLGEKLKLLNCFEPEREANDFMASSHTIGDPSTKANVSVSHETRMVQEGARFETSFDRKRLGEKLKLLNCLDELEPWANEFMLPSSRTIGDPATKTAVSVRHERQKVREGARLEKSVGRKRLGEKLKLLNCLDEHEPWANEFVVASSSTIGDPATSTMDSERPRSQKVKERARLENSFGRKRLGEKLKLLDCIHEHEPREDHDANTTVDLNDSWNSQTASEKVRKDAVRTAVSSKASRRGLLEKMSRLSSLRPLKDDTKCKGRSSSPENDAESKDLDHDDLSEVIELSSVEADDAQGQDPAKMSMTAETELFEEIESSSCDDTAMYTEREDSTSLELANAIQEDPRVGISSDISVSSARVSTEASRRELLEKLQRLCKPVDALTDEHESASILKESEETASDDAAFQDNSPSAAPQETPPIEATSLVNVSYFGLPVFVQPCADDDEVSMLSMGSRRRIHPHHKKGRTKSKKVRAKLDDDRYTPLPCLCGKEECNGISAAFYMLQDPRSGYTLLPEPINEGGCSHFDSQVKQLKESYFRHILPKDACDESLNNTDSSFENIRYVANHHFHPMIVSRGMCPMFVSGNDLFESLYVMGLSGEDRVLDEHGQPTGDYFVVPNYATEKTKKDLKRAIALWKLMND